MHYEEKHVLYSSITCRGQNYIIVKVKRQTANITVRYWSFLTVLILLLHVELGNADIKKTDGWVTVVDESFSFRGSSILQNGM